jgi:hypothetical protein
MRKIKVKLKYSEMQVMDHLLTDTVHELDKRSYANKAVMALLVEYALRSIKPHIYIRYDKPRNITMPIAVACGIIHLYQSIEIADMYQLHVLRTVVINIEPKIPQL